VLDEPCVHLDMKSREFLMETIDLLAGKPDAPSIIFISHRIEEISPLFNRGMILKKGKILAQGAREETLTEENLYAAFDIHVQFLKTDDGRLWPFIRKQLSSEIHENNKMCFRK